ncbi:MULTISPECIES: FTR1 family protein [unclassified Streptomyces]|uniref:FTR1 family iron permease n=1 Tax=unclassified Streptomyces TaxID=2593676 RepID=UPI0033A4BDD9
MYGTYLFGLREGLAAAAVLCVLVAYLVRTGRRDALRPVGAGAAAAAGLSLALGALLEFGAYELTPEARKLLGGVLAVGAAGLLTWLVVAERPGAGLVAGTAFLAVGREGLETALFVWATVRAAADEAGSAEPLTWVLVGLATAAAVGWLFFRCALRCGPLLVVVAAGVLAGGVRGLQEVVAPGGAVAFDVSAVVRPDSWYGAVLRGVFTFQPDPTVLQSAVWALYPVPALALLRTPVGFGRSVGVEEQKATDEKAGSGSGGEARGDGDGDRGAGADRERVRDGARRAGGRPGGEQD